MKSSNVLPKGTILKGTYRVEEVLGRGGFGITYAGRDIRTGRKVAVKEYFPAAVVCRDTDQSLDVCVCTERAHSEYSGGLQRFEREAKNLFSFVNVPGVVSVLDYFQSNKTAYLVMEYVEGITLREYLKLHGGYISEREALQIIRPVLIALEKIHLAGVIHRDISPDNIMLSFADGDPAGDLQQVTLIDFGAARMANLGENKRNTIVLKHGYAPEEQYRAYGEQGPWTDIYAVCATIYRAVCGSRPADAMDRLRGDGVLNFPSDAANADAGKRISKRTRQALEKGLAVRWQERTASAGELYAQLYKAGPGPGRKKGKRILILASMLALTCMGTVIYGIRKEVRVRTLSFAETGYIRIPGGDTRQIREGEAMLLQIESNLDHLQVSCDDPSFSVGWDDKTERNLKIIAAGDLTDGEQAHIIISGPDHKTAARLTVLCCDNP